jgi:hypothetical protein
VAAVARGVRCRPLPGAWLADHTAWMPRSCSSNDMNAASTPYPAGPAGPGAAGMGLAGRPVVPGRGRGPSRRMGRRAADLPRPDDLHDALSKVSSIPRGTH